MYLSGLTERQSIVYCLKERQSIVLVLALMKGFVHPQIFKDYHLTSCLGIWRYGGS